MVPPYLNFQIKPRKTADYSDIFKNIEKKKP